ncbi:PAS domain S-box/diguanylate cyclase (GGDEF) domain-containing protein [Sphaerochaeta pleomorpha str. Grapes]|uniref:diguanylate cyclase n=1 Tax=Sphaerochaeta pleomorpha (strain ATCC BAA-1885 / DSM 22778 / Grapes) TaxID=158190 RepID=G8QY37_SPHPG|nr:sensor domain-containing diguanylate cyclase [Sphaerochaeta pleomorpha]AEV29602.1 PAS domain S-box/diguanylate cyclase (GGDEF) domain-containing protein [Sphaerochaeta pleomorpha str. Grapes]
MESENLSELSLSLFNTIPDPFLVISEDGIYLEVFGGTERTLYDDAHTLKGRNLFDFLEPEFARFFMDKITETLKGNTLNCFEYELQTEQVDLPDKNGPGGLQWFEARMYPLPSPYKGYRAVTAMLINISERKILHQRLNDLSYLDPLTAIANRRFFLERITEELQRYLINRVSVHVLLCDIDHFKNINDNHGHLAGDYVLKEFTSIAKSVFSVSHTIARFGGDEFVISVVGLTTEQVMQRCEQLRQSVQDHPFVYENQTMNIQVCIGVSEVSSYDTDISKLIGRADKALYLAKETGRNKVIFLK